MSGQRVPDQPDDVVAWITVRLHSIGTMSISGTIGDAAMCRAMLDHARDAITRNVKDAGICVPSRDVEVEPVRGLVEMGDIQRSERGDP